MAPTPRRRERWYLQRRPLEATLKEYTDQMPQEQIPTGKRCRKPRHLPNTGTNTPNQAEDNADDWPGPVGRETEGMLSQSEDLQRGGSETSWKDPVGEIIKDSQVRPEMQKPGNEREDTRKYKPENRMNSRQLLQRQDPIGDNSPEAHADTGNHEWHESTKLYSDATKDPIRRRTEVTDLQNHQPQNQTNALPPYHTGETHNQRRNHCLAAPTPRYQPELTSGRHPPFCQGAPLRNQDYGKPQDWTDTNTLHHWPSPQATTQGLPLFGYPTLSTPIPRVPDTYSEFRKLFQLTAYIQSIPHNVNGHNTIIDCVYMPRALTEFLQIPGSPKSTTY